MSYSPFGIQVSFKRKLESMNDRDGSEFLLRALSLACKRMDGYDDKVWEESLGRNVSRVCGPLATLSRLGVLRKGGCLRLARSPPFTRSVCSGVQERSVAIAQLMFWRRLARACAVSLRAPRSCEAWVEEFERLQVLFQEHGLLQRGNYLRCYVSRALLLAEMHRCRVRRLSGPDRVLTKVFFATCLDEKMWQNKMQRPGKTSTLAEFFRDVRYDGRPELFSMFTCLLLCEPMRQSLA